MTDYPAFRSNETSDADQVNAKQKAVEASNARSQKSVEENRGGNREQRNAAPRNNGQASKRPIIGLFNYGGGMRGLLPAHFMQRIEDVTGLQMADMVDVFMGPSTGSILNAALNIPDPHNPTRPKFRARHMVRFYEREGAHIFPHDSFRALRSMIHDFNNRTLRLTQLERLFRHGHYEQANLGRSLRGMYGRHKISDTLKSIIIPVYNIDGPNGLGRGGRGAGAVPVPTSSLNSIVSPSQLQDMGRGGESLWLKNIYFDGAQNVAPPQDADLFDAVMASTAAPTYFPCYSFKIKDHPDEPARKITGIDGSIFDNPCISYMGALRPHLPPDRDFIMIVFGTGNYNRAFCEEDWNRYGSLGVVDPNNDMPLINIFFYASESALNQSFHQELGDRLYVFNKSLFSGTFKRDYPSPDIDDASPENIRKLHNFFEMTLEENRKGFNEICELLVKNYDLSQSEPKDSKNSKDSRKGN